MELVDVWTRIDQLEKTVISQAQRIEQLEQYATVNISSCRNKLDQLEKVTTHLFVKLRSLGQSSNNNNADLPLNQQQINIDPHAGHRNLDRSQPNINRNNIDSLNINHINNPTFTAYRDKNSCTNSNRNSSTSAFQPYPMNPAVHPSSAIPPMNRKPVGTTISINGNRSSLNRNSLYTATSTKLAPATIKIPLPTTTIISQPLDQSPGLDSDMMSESPHMRHSRQRFVENVIALGYGDVTTDGTKSTTPNNQNASKSNGDKSSIDGNPKNASGEELASNGNHSNDSNKDQLYEQTSADAEKNQKKDSQNDTGIDLGKDDDQKSSDDGGTEGDRLHEDGKAEVEIIFEDQVQNRKVLDRIDEPQPPKKAKLVELEETNNVILASLPYSYADKAYDDLHEYRMDSLIDRNKLPAPPENEPPFVYLTFKKIVHNPFERNPSKENELPCDPLNSIPGSTLPYNLRCTLEKSPFQ